MIIVMVWGLLQIIDGLFYQVKYPSTMSPDDQWQVIHKVCDIHHIRWTVVVALVTLRYLPIGIYPAVVSRVAQSPAGIRRDRQDDLKTAGGCRDGHVRPCGLTGECTVRDTASDVRSVGDTHQVVH